MALRALPVLTPVETTAEDPLRRCFLVIVLLAGLLMLSTAGRDEPDLWGHVRYGQDVIATGRLSSTATHTFTVPDYPWINHENLAEITFGLLANRFGGAGLLALEVLLGALVLGLMIAAAVRRGATPPVTCLAVLAAATNMAPGWNVRPQLFSYTFFALLVVLIDWTHASRDRRVLWLVPPLFAVWANAHGGFVAGLAALALYLGGESLEALWRHGTSALGRVAADAAVLGASVAATALNPYGIHLLTWLVQDLNPPRPEISEWGALVPPDPLFYAATILLVLVVAGRVWGREPRDLGRTLVLAAVAWQTFAHGRHAPFFGILGGFWLPPGLEALRARFRRPTSRQPRAPSARGLALVRTAGWLTAGLLAIVLATRSHTIWVHKDRYPVDAFQFMADHHLVGKLVVHFDWAQYAIAAFAPETTVAFDGRFRTCYPQEIADMHFDFILGDMPGHRWRSERSGPIDPGRTLELGRPDLVLTNRNYPTAEKVIRARPDWVLLYQDGLAQVWGRRERYDDPASPDYVRPAERAISDRRPDGRVPWPALPVPRTRA